MQYERPFENHSSEHVIAELKRACTAERRCVVEVLLLLAEVDRRELYAELGYPSLYQYCVQTLGFSEHEAYLRIEVSRAGRRFPVLFEMFEKGSLHLTGATLVAPHLTPENRDELLAKVARRS